MMSTTSLRRLVSGSCIETRFTPWMPSVLRRWWGKQRFERHALDQARLARGDLRDDRGEDRVLATRDAGHLHESVVLLQVHMAVRFPERRFGLQILGVDIALDDDLRFGGYEQVDGLRFHDIDRRADEPPATCNSSSDSGTFCAEVNATHGGAPRITAAGNFSPRAFIFSQWV